VNKCGKAGSAQLCWGLTDVAFIYAGFGLAFFEFTPYAPSTAVRCPPCRTCSQYLKSQIWDFYL